MLYLIKSAGYKEEGEGMKYFPLLKIGYTEDNRKEVRYSQYKMHNPTCQVLFEIPGATEDHEKRVQYKFRDLLFPNYGREWFSYSEEIIEFFKGIKSLEELDKLPKNPIRGDQIVLLGKREARKILLYLFDTKEEIENYLDELMNILGDTISYSTSLEYIKGDQSIDKDKLSHYLRVIESRETGVYCEDDLVNQEVSEFMKVYESKITKFDKFKLLCEYGLSKEVLGIVLAQIPNTDEVKSCYLALGSQKIKSLYYNITNIRKALGVVMFSPELLIQEIYSEFREGEKYTLSNLKLKLNDVYSSINYNSTPKANDIERYFEIKEFSIYEKKPDGGRKKVRGYELLRSREQELRQELRLIG